MTSSPLIVDLFLALKAFNPFLVNLRSETANASHVPRCPALKTCCWSSPYTHQIHVLCLLNFANFRVINIPAPTIISTIPSTRPDTKHCSGSSASRFRIFYASRTSLVRNIAFMNEVTFYLRCHKLSRYDSFVVGSKRKACSRNVPSILILCEMLEIRRNENCELCGMNSNKTKKRSSYFWQYFFSFSAVQKWNSTKQKSIKMFNTFQCLRLLLRRTLNVNGIR